MAFRQCDACDGLIASRAVVCPHCDVALPAPEMTLRKPDRMAGPGTWGSFIIVLVIVVLLADLSGVAR